MSELVVTGLTATVGGTQILKGVDVTVRSGEVHAVMGPNGSGKSTLSNVLMGRPGYEVTGGTVTLDGVDLLALPTWERARAGLFLAMQYPTEVPGVQLRGAVGPINGSGPQVVGDARQDRHQLCPPILFRNGQIGDAGHTTSQFRQVAAHLRTARPVFHARTNPYRKRSAHPPP